MTRNVITSLDQIPPSFDSEDAERAWWADHEIDERLWEQLLDTTQELDAILPLGSTRPGGRQQPKQRRDP